MSYLLYQADNIVGVFDDLQKGKDMAQSVIDNGWATNFSIVKYKTNTCIKVKTIEIDDGEKDNEIENEYKELNSSDDEKNKIDKTELQHKLNILKFQKDKIEESKNKYEVDVKLYHEFKKKLEEDINFAIPELFEEKYKIFHQLDVQNNLNWETFSLLYKEQDFHGNYSNVFDVTNEFETKFLTNIDSDTESESDIENSNSSSDFSNSDNIIEIVQVLNSSDEDNSSSD